MRWGGGVGWWDGCDGMGVVECLWWNGCGGMGVAVGEVGWVLWDGWGGMGVEGWVWKDG